MFTGLVETTGIIVERSVNGGAGRFVVRPHTRFKNLEYGESIAINGTCLTMESESEDGSVVFHVLEETLKRTNLGGIAIGGKVNLERALAVGSRLGGHLVSGHVDVTAKLISLQNTGSDVELKIELPDELKRYVVAKGSICIDGISLTLVDITDSYFTVHLIPVTLAETALEDRKPGDLINLEADIIGKYVERQLGLASSSQSNVTMDVLREAGW